MHILVLLLALVLATTAWADIPATPVMTLYRFNSALTIPYYEVDTFRQSGASRPAGTLPQGTSVVPCLVIDNNKPLTDNQGVPYVGFQIVVDPRHATQSAAEHYRNLDKKRQAQRVINHHCDAGVRHVLDVRALYAMAKPPVFDPPQAKRNTPIQAVPPLSGAGELDQIIRAFHNSSACERANQNLLERRRALQEAWNRFIKEQQSRWPSSVLQRAMHLDYAMRTALFEGHLERGCNAYGACERNIIALSIRNRGEACARRQGCKAPFDYQGVVTAVSQYNIWDEYLTQISGLTTCFLRDDLANTNTAHGQNYRKLQAMYAQNLADIQRILYGSDQELTAIFPQNTLADLKRLKHYYHAPAMGKCFPAHNRVAYISGAVAHKGRNFALLANTRIHVDQKVADGYTFRSFMVREEASGDKISIIDTYPGFIVDGRRVALSGGGSPQCAPYGIPGGCQLNGRDRSRKTPSWVNTGKPLAIQCRIADQGEQCQGKGAMKTVEVGGQCDTEMRPFSGVP